MRRRKAWLLGGVLLLAFVGVGVYQVATPPDMPPLHVGMTYEQVFALPWGSASYLLPVDSGDPGALQRLHHQAGLARQLLGSDCLLRPRRQSHTESG